MNRKEKKKLEEWIPEEPLKKQRKGGAVKLILISLMLEAARMKEEGMDVISIEASGKKAFGISKGFLTLMDEVGIPEFMEEVGALYNPSSDDPIFKYYQNFFQPPQTLVDMNDRYQKTDDKSSVKWISEEKAQMESSDLMVLEMLKKRFQAVAFMVSSEVVQAGVMEMKDVERLCQKYLGWKEGPFTMMNRIGIKESLKMVTEKMELSHKKEINFPISRLLIKQAQQNTPWEI